jgi:hypothetical protein
MVAPAVAAADMADALTIGRDGFTDATTGGLAGWEVTAAAADVQPGPGLTGAEVRPTWIELASRRVEPERAGHMVVVHFHVAGQGQYVAAFLVRDGDRVLGERDRDLFQR